MGTMTVRATKTGTTQMGPAASHVLQYEGVEFLHKWRNHQTCCVSFWRGRAGNSPKVTPEGENPYLPHSPAQPSGTGRDADGQRVPGAAQGLTVCPPSPWSPAAS